MHHTISMEPLNNADHWTIGENASKILPLQAEKYINVRLNDTCDNKNRLNVNDDGVSWVHFSLRASFSVKTE